MQVLFGKSFLKDLKRLRLQRTVSQQIEAVIGEVKSASHLQEINNIRKLKGYPNYYRIRVGDFRIGLCVEESQVIFLRCLNRKEVYRYFP